MAATTDTKKRIPALISKNPIFASFLEDYLSVLDKIAEYNKDVLSATESEWTPSKVLVEARKFASPENADDQDAEIKQMLDDWEALVAEAMTAKRQVVEATAKKLGITLSATSERDPAIEGPLKDERKRAHDIGSTLMSIAGMTNDEAVKGSIKEFFDGNPLPMVGRDQSHNFGSDSGSTPKYRVSVTVKNADGEVLGIFDGFTKTAQALSKPVFGYERGKSPKADDLRKVWEDAGNSHSDMYKVPSVPFTDNGLNFEMTKK